MAAAESALVQAWYRGAGWLKCLLPLSLLFWAISTLRRLAFRTGLRKSQSSSVPVIVVGNITVGGSGKSPLVSYLVKAFQAQGLNPGVVSRGYGAKPPITMPMLLVPDSRAMEVGDEPLMLYRSLNCPVCVCPDRRQAVHVLEQQGCDLIISDDGLQHYAMHRDIEICVFDRERLWGNGYMLPAGPLREPLSRMQDTDFIVLNGASGKGEDPRTYLQTQRELARPAMSIAAVPVMEMALVAGHLKRLGGEEVMDITQLAGKSIRAIAGIGHPERFFETLRAQGAKVQSQAFGDHHQFAQADFEALNDRMIVMTEKDAVKCADLQLDNAWYLPVTAQLSDNLALAIQERLAQSGRWLPKH
ncbi:MAG: tetraacyldisaccharide 4'-kinase [Oleiphilus sp.]|nr:MAG: tetraacyldisaccharide 4'-kinase [Oleiphilus sp.]